MRRMFSEKQLQELIGMKINSAYIVEKLQGQDINVEGITSKGIANTGGFANIGNAAISGNLEVQGEGKGKITANTIAQRSANWEQTFSLSVNASFSKTEYCKLALINGILWIIVSGRYTNISESTQTFITGDQTLPIPDSLKSKIYDKTNKPISEDVGNTQISVVRGTTLARVNQSSSQSSNYELYHKGTNLYFFPLNAGISNIAPSGYVDVDLRIPLFVL